MEIKTLSKSRAMIELKDWLDNPQLLPTIGDAYEGLRRELTEFYEESVKQIPKNDIRKEYLLDVYFGISMYDYLNKQGWMNLREAANDEFWYYLSIKVIPNIVKQRYAKLENGVIVNMNVLEERFFKTPARIWLKTIWWFIHIAWQTNKEETIRLLTKPAFNIDVMAGIMERTGKDGMYVNLYKEILKVYGDLKDEVRNNYKQYLSQGKTDTLLRAVMRLHTARVLVTDPCLYEGGIGGYVGDLFKEFTDRIKKCRGL